MDRQAISIFIFSIIFIVINGQMRANGFIGNRAYSSWYKTHFLVRRKGLCKLIYYKPKHFGRYTVHEVLSFFESFLLPLIFGIMAILVSVGVLSCEVLLVILFSCVVIILINDFVIVLINDIGSHKDEKKQFYLETGTREVLDYTNLPTVDMGKKSKFINKVIAQGIKQENNSYYTIHNLYSSYYARIKKAKNDVEKTEIINKEYINHFRNIENLVVLKENKDGSLVFKK